MARRPGGERPSPDFPQFFCPAVNPRACTELHRVWVCKMDHGEFEFVYQFNNNFNPFRSFLSLPFAGSSLHRNQNFNSSFLSSNGFRPHNQAPGISASVRIEWHAATVLAMLEIHEAQGFSGLALVLVVTILPERSTIMEVGFCTSLFQIDGHWVERGDCHNCTVVFFGQVFFV